MTPDGWTTLWRMLPHLFLCIAVLLVLRRQIVLHRAHMAKLDDLENAVRTLSDDDPSAARRPRDDPVPNAEALLQSRLRTIDTLLQRR